MVTTCWPAVNVNRVASCACVAAPPSSFRDCASSRTAFAFAPGLPRARIWVLTLGAASRRLIKFTSGTSTSSGPVLPGEPVGGRHAPVEPVQRFELAAGDGLALGRAGGDRDRVIAKPPGVRVVEPRVRELVARSGVVAEVASEAG